MAAVLIKRIAKSALRRRKVYDAGTAHIYSSRRSGLFGVGGTNRFDRNPDIGFSPAVYKETGGGYVVPVGKDGKGRA